MFGATSSLFGKLNELVLLGIVGGGSTLILFFFSFFFVAFIKIIAIKIIVILINKIRSIKSSIFNFVPAFFLYLVLQCPYGIPLGKPRI